MVSIKRPILTRVDDGDEAPGPIKNARHWAAGAWVCILTAGALTFVPDNAQGRLALTFCIAAALCVYGLLEMIQRQDSDHVVQLSVIMVSEEGDNDGC